MGMCMGDPFGIGNDKLGLVDSFQPAQFRGKFLKLLHRPPQRDDFHAKIMVQMHMHRRNDAIAMLVLDPDHLFGQVGPVMVKNQCQTRRDIAFLPMPCIQGQFLPQEFANGLAPRGELSLAAIGVEAIQKVRFEGNRKTDDFSHGVTSPDNGFSLFPHFVKSWRRGPRFPCGTKIV